MAISYSRKDVFEVLSAFIAVAISVCIIMLTYYAIYPAQAPQPIRSLFERPSRSNKGRHVGFKVVKDSNAFSLYQDK